jgi:hypothetical protein
MRCPIVLSAFRGALVSQPRIIEGLPPLYRLPFSRLVPSRTGRASWPWPDGCGVFERTGALATYPDGTRAYVYELKSIE